MKYKGTKVLNEQATDSIQKVLVGSGPFLHRGSKFESAFRPIGVIGGGSIPLALVGSIVLLLILLRYFSIGVALSATNNVNKGDPMEKTLTARTLIFLSSIFETMWAIGVSSVVGHLSA